MAQILPALYYLENFRSALDSLKIRYAQLLSKSELAFVQEFAVLPQASQCLLARMLTRKGAHFRRVTLQYPEVGDLEDAIGNLAQLGWLDIDPVVTLEELFRILSREDWRRTFGINARKRSDDHVSAQLALPLLSDPGTSKALSHWGGHLANSVVHLAIEPLAKRLQWLYFGNDRQTWAEFVLSDLGVKRYEQVPCGPTSCAFKSRDEVEHFYHLQECRARLRADESAASILAEIRCPSGMPDWLQTQFVHFQLRLGDQLERQGCRDLALSAYQQCGTAEAYIRVVRLKERDGMHADAWAEAVSAQKLIGTERQRQVIGRALDRLGRRRGDMTAKTAVRRTKPLVVVNLRLPPLTNSERVERRVCMHLSSTESPTFYVENSLFPSLFGLLCWDAIFAPLPGAFFHPFQSGPADLYMPEFKVRRAAQFDTLLDLLDSGKYKEIIERHYCDKAGLSSNFVRWGRLKPQVLSLALACIPPAHLKLVFERFLGNLEDNCAGLPDLVQFWPEERRYRLVEVKAPGDRLQDNQRRWMDFFMQHDMPASVYKIEWT